MTKARNLADLISDGVIGTTELADDVITPVQLSETGNYVMAQLNVTGASAFGDNLVLNGASLYMQDNDKAIFGNGSDLQIYHNGGDSIIADTGTGDLYIRGSNDIRLQSATGSDTYAHFQESGYAKLYHNNSAKFETTSTGIQVTGNATFADNGKAIFGAGDDLQIYHDGSHSRITDAGTGSLLIDGDEVYVRSSTGENKIIADTNGGVNLFYDNASKLTTTSTGIDVQSGANAIVSVGRASAYADKGRINFNTGRSYIESEVITGTANGDTYLAFGTQNGGTISERMRIGSSGDVSITNPSGISINTDGASNHAYQANVDLHYNGTAGGHQDGIRFFDKRNFQNAAVVNNLTNDGVNIGAAELRLKTSHAGTLYDRLKIDQYGRVTMPYQPAFMARLDTSFTIGPTPATLPAGTAVYNIGGHYSTGTYRFTAPVAGRYLFASSIQYGSTGGSHFNLYVNNSASFAGQGWVDFGDTTGVTQTMIHNLAAGDYVEAKIYHSVANTNVSTGRTKWMGYLIG